MKMKQWNKYVSKSYNAGRGRNSEHKRRKDRKRENEREEKTQTPGIELTLSGDR
jgi:hypothetical protein